MSDSWLMWAGAGRMQQLPLQTDKSQPALESACPAAVRRISVVIAAIHLEQISNEIHNSAVI
jgi:hypothetical protein